MTFIKKPIEVNHWFISGIRSAPMYRKPTKNKRNTKKVYMSTF